MEEGNEIQKNQFRTSVVRPWCVRMAMEKDIGLGEAELGCGRLSGAEAEGRHRVARRCGLCSGLGKGFTEGSSSGN